MIHLILIAMILINLKVNASVTPHQADATTNASMQQTYDSKFDNIDLEEILGQERLLKNYVKCLEGTGPCTPDGRMLKETLPDAIATDCAKCTAKQKYGSEKVTHNLIDYHPLDWERLEKIYDPEGKYRRNYLANKSDISTAATTVATILTNTTAKKI